MKKLEAAVRIINERVEGPCRVNQFAPLEMRLWSRVRIDEGTGCWVWLGVCPTKYGAINVNGRQTRVHRVAYELIKGAIPTGLVIDHLCRNKICVNPDHLEAVTLAENTRRWSATVTHCPEGHEYTPDNIFNSKRGDKACKRCKRERRYARLRAIGQRAEGGGK